MPTDDLRQRLDEIGIFNEEFLDERKKLLGDEKISADATR